MCNCGCYCTPTYLVSSIAIDSTTGIATLTLDTSSISSGKFTLRFKCCGQTVSPCFTETLNIVAGTTTYANVLQSDGNYVRLGQLANNINKYKVVHCNLTTNPSGNVMVLDKVCPCAFTGTVSNAPTVITVN